MGDASIERLEAGHLTIDVARADNGRLEVVWRGRSNERYPDKVLQPYFARILGAAGDPGVDMRFSDLEYFNSSTIAAVIELIKDAREKRVRLRLLYDRKLRWQKTSFDALKVFVRDDDLLQLKPV